MHSARPSVPPRPRRFDSGRRVDPKPLNHTNKREEKNINTVSSSPRHVTRRPPEPSRLKSIGHTARSSVGHLKVVQKNSAHPVPANSKSKGGHGASNAGIPAVDPNCNEPSLPCLCCNDHPTQDSNSLFNHNHNNNNTVTIRQQLKFAPPSQKRKEAEKKPETRKAKCKPEEKQPMTEPIAKPVEDREEENGNVKETEGGDHKDDDAGDNVKEMEGGDQKDDDAGVNVKGKVDENGNGNNDVVVDGAADDDNDDEDDDDDEDENTLVPSCCDCPASLLDFSLTSSTSSSSTSISSCSDLDSDCPDGFSTSLQEQEATENYPSPHSSPSHTTAFQPYSLPLDLSTSVRPPSSSCSPDEGYPSPSTSPTSDFLDNKEPEEEKSIKVDVLNFLDSIDELGKVDCFYRIAQVAQWEFEGDLDLRDRLLHQEKLEKVNRQVKLTYLERLQEAGRDFDDEDLSGLVDEMGNIDISWKFYKSDKSYDSQDYSDAGVDMTAPSDLDEPTVPDSLAPSPIDPPPRPPKPPARHVSAQSEMHTYMNISGNTPSVSSNSSPTKSLSLAVPPSPSSLSSAISKPLALPPQPPQPVPYFTLYTESPAVSSPAPPIPPPRRRHKARLEAQRLAELAREKTPQSLPAPTTRPPPLPPPPAMTSPPAIPPPPSLPPPPSFHALDVEIRKLLALAGITQAELLRLSPELGVCVDGVLEEEEKSKVSKNGNVCANKTSKSEKEEVCKGNELSWKDERIEENGLGKNSLKEVISLDALNKEEAFIDEKEECKDTFRTTSFTEMARRRKRNGGSSNSSCSCGLGDDSTLKADSYYSTGISNKQFTDASFGSFDYQYASVIPDSPPPPPPRPLPPRPRLLSDPPELPPLKPCTLPANASLPDRFDWLIAFTPDTEAPPLEIKKSLADSTPQKSNSGPKVTTFKELRNRGKQASPPTRVQPEPDPTIVTPDPDFLYNLKWRREKADGDGTQWEYTSQAQATFLQPPPTPASLALFREIRHLNIEGNVSLELSSLQRIGCSTNKPNWGPFDEDPKTEHHKKKEKVEDEKETEVRGTADGGRTWESRTRAVRSVSFTGPVAKSGTWMGDDARTHLRGDELSSLCLQEKRALVSAVSVAVEAILAQFSSSRTLVQKALSGDSSVNPTLGRLLLQCLCPALRGLLCDGLKPHQSDLIAGRRPNSPWGLVLASTKPGSSTQALYNLKAKVSALPQLRQNRHRFNAFLLGLLNIKRLDFWLSHVQACSDVLETYYRRTAFMRLAGTSCKPLFDELLLLLQPLSLLTFNIDLLFQHHHLDPSSPDLTPSGRSPDPSSPPGQDPRFCSSQSQVSGPHLRGVSMQDFGDLDSKAASLNSVSLRSFNARSLYCRPISSGIGKGETTPQLQWLQEKEIAPPSVGSVNILTQQAGQALQQGWGAVLRWGERLGQNWSGLSSFGSSEEPEGLQRVEDLSTDAVSSARQKPGQELSTADSGAVLWDLGRLFGASKSPTNPPMKRRPSQWLSPGITILSRMTSTGQNFLPEKIEPVRNMEKEMRKDEDKEMDQPKPLRAVRTLCDHTGNGAELSFRKGEELILLGGVDQDWIRCRQGDKEGLVPIGFASLIM
ncbi:RUN and SH3 domain containing 1 isoform X4 [Brachyhypopomus gauderio]|uniref:RUN and SH3 domain containing 1 isoform X4 n=1 Tax=Brachyhypopomus gauderio TaxID=698409 RepID=UPI0040415123